LKVLDSVIISVKTLLVIGPIESTERNFIIINRLKSGGMKRCYDSGAVKRKMCEHEVNELSRSKQRKSLDAFRSCRL